MHALLQVPSQQHQLQQHRLGLAGGRHAGDWHAGICMKCGHLLMCLAPAALEHVFCHPFAHIPLCMIAICTVQMGPKYT
jgi:hypothetical protein